MRPDLTSAKRRLLWKVAMSMTSPISGGGVVGGSVRARCHDLAQFGKLCRGGGAAKRGRGAAEEAAEARGEMAVAGEAGIECDGGQIVAAIEHGVERLREALMHDVVV